MNGVVSPPALKDKSSRRERYRCPYLDVSSAALHSPPNTARRTREPKTRLCCGWRQESNVSSLQLSRELGILPRSAIAAARGQSRATLGRRRVHQMNGVVSPPALKDKSSRRERYRCPYLDVSSAALHSPPNTARRTREPKTRLCCGWRQESNVSSLQLSRELGIVYRLITRRAACERRAHDSVTGRLYSNRTVLHTLPIPHAYTELGGYPRTPLLLSL